MRISDWSSDVCSSDLQAVVHFALPFALQQGLDGRAPFDEFGPVAPAAVRRIGERDFRRVAAVPGIFGQPRLLGGGLGIERRQRWAGHEVSWAGVLYR